MAFYLVFRDKLFNEVTQAELTESDLAVLEIENTKSTLYFHQDINLIDKLTAQRQVNSIVKTGFLLSSNQRVGSNTSLKVVVGSIPMKNSGVRLEKKTETKKVTEEAPNVDRRIKTDTEETPNLIKELEAVTENIPNSIKESKNATEQVAETYERPIIFDVNKDTMSDTDNTDVSGFTSLDNLGVNDSKNNLRIGDIFREEQKKVMEDDKPESKTPKTFDDLVTYFWKILFGQVYTSWDSLPEEAKEDFFSSLNITRLSDNELQELFAIRHENNIEAFKQKLNEFQAKNKL